MKIKLPLLLIICLVAAQPALAGAWGDKSFDNDDARDWVDNELKEDGQRAVRNAIGFVVGKSGYLEAPQCCYAVAACEVLAAARGRPAPDLPKEVAALAKTLPTKTVDAVRKDAVKALDKIIAKSELRDLVEESGGFAKWKALMDELKSRLE